MQRGTPAPPVDPDRLNGWKEIASFLGKGVRTAQRWERELDLPIHRLGREGGEIVFAFKSEITAWSLGHDAARRGEAPGAGSREMTRAEAAVEDQATVGGGPGRRLMAVAAASVLAGAALVTLVLRGGGFDPPRQPASWRVSSDTISVLDERGGLLWTHRFPAPLNDAAYTNVGVFPRLGPVTIADIDADGNREVLVGLVFNDLRSPRQGFVAFNHDGTQRFWFAPDPVVRFGSTEYRGPWICHRVFVTRHPDRPPSLWVIFVHGMEFPTLLVELDPSGNVRSEYWSNGYIESLAETTWRGRPAVLAGGTNNETHGASLAVFDRGQVAGSAPALNPEYRCADCPPGPGPVEFLLFPRRCIFRVTEGQSVITQIWKDSGDRLHVAVTEWGPGPPIDANVYYWLDPDLTPERAEVSPELLSLHRQLERTGYLDHAFGPADEANLFPVRRWNGSTFVDLPTAPVTR